MAAPMQLRSGSAPPHHAPTPRGFDLDGDLFRKLALGLLVALLAGAIWLAVQGEQFNALAIGSLALLGAAFAAGRKWLPSLFTLFFLIAAGVNAAGYAFNLWKSPVWFDEAVHAGTSFTVMAAIGWMLLARTWLNAAGRTAAFTLAVTGLGFLIGVLWEVFEWVIGIIGTPADTLVDVTMDMIGAIAAGLFCAWATNKGARVGQLVSTLA